MGRCTYREQRKLSGVFVPFSCAAFSALSLSRKLKMVLKQNQPLQYDTHVLKGCPTLAKVIT
jgi:hypothetical protein